MKKNIILMGLPGSGKGTQAKNLAEKFNAFYFGTGDLMREEAKKNTEYGKIFQAVWDKGRGELIPDDIVEKFVAEKFASVDFGQGIVFDGFPRTLKQAQHLEKVFTEKNEDFIVIDIEVSDESIINRMAKRRVCANCGKIFIEGLSADKCTKCGGDLVRRQEDEPEVVKKRLEVYDAQTKPLIDFFRNEGRLIVVDGEPAIEDVEREIERVVNE